MSMSLNKFRADTSEMGERHSGIVLQLWIRKFPVESHWCTWPGFGIKLRYEAPVDFPVKLDNVELLAMGE